MSMWFIFASTFTVFTGAFLKSHFDFMKGMKDREAWYNLSINILFNVFDATGRKLGGSYSISDKLVPILSLLRLVFIPTTLLIARFNCDGDLATCPHKMSGGLLDEDWFAIINMILYAFSNGFLST